MIQAERLRPSWLIASLGVLFGVVVASLVIGPADIGVRAALGEVLDHVPGVNVDSGLSETNAAIVWKLRAPRLVLGILVGAMLSIAGASYQAVFRNPLASPYQLGAAAGGGLGATIAIVNGWGDGAGFFDALPLLAFVGAIGAVGATWVLSNAAGGVRSIASLLLAGVAVTAFLTAIQTFIQQRNVDTIRQVYSWILGSLANSSWNEVYLALPYVLVMTAVILVHRRRLDVMSVGDAEATTLGLRPARVRAVVVVAATLGTAAAVAVGGLIAFVGLIVPHTVRLVAGTSNRVVLPLSFIVGGAFLAGVDLLARSIATPAEVPIGVLTAAIGAPFFIMVLRTSRRLVA